LLAYAQSFTIPLIADDHPNVSQAIVYEAACRSRHAAARRHDPSVGPRRAPSCHVGVIGRPAMPRKHEREHKLGLAACKRQPSSVILIPTSSVDCVDCHAGKGQFLKMLAQVTEQQPALVRTRDVRLHQLRADKSYAVINGTPPFLNRIVTQALACGEVAVR
jgi:hypothetical protein